MQLNEIFINSASEMHCEEKKEKFFRLLSLLSNYELQGLDNLVNKVLTPYWAYQYQQDPAIARQFYINQNKLIRLINSNHVLRDYLKLFLL
jgi:hypothetical protein